MAKYDDETPDLIVGIPETKALREAKVSAEEIGRMVKEIAGGAASKAGSKRFPAVRVRSGRGVAQAAGASAGAIGDPWDPPGWIKTIWRRFC